MFLQRVIFHNNNKQFIMRTPSIKIHFANGLDLVFAKRMLYWFVWFQNWLIINNMRRGIYRRMTFICHRKYAVYNFLQAIASL